MSCTTTCVRKHVRKDCALGTDITQAWFACPEDVTLGFSDDGGTPALCTEGTVNAITVDNGVDPDNAFHEFEFKTDGDQKATFNWQFTKNDDGTNTKTQTWVMTIDYDSPELRCAIEKLEGIPHDWILRYPGEVFPYDYIKDLELTDAAFSSETRSWTLTFTKENPVKRPTLIWSTDFVTTQSLVNAVIAP